MVDDDVYTDWESVYRDNIDRLYRLMHARVGNRPDAEDLTSEVFSTALPPMRLSSSKGEVRAYLLVTAKTVLASYWRRRLGHPVTTIDMDTDLRYLSEPSGPEPPSDAPARAGEILGGLPERYRRILELRFLEACSIKEAARAMHITRNWVTGPATGAERSRRDASVAGVSVGAALSVDEGAQVIAVPPSRCIPHCRWSLA